MESRGRMGWSPPARDLPAPTGPTSTMRQACPFHWLQYPPKIIHFVPSQLALFILPPASSTWCTALRSFCKARQVQPHMALASMLGVSSLSWARQTATTGTPPRHRRSCMCLDLPCPTRRKQFDRAMNQFPCHCHSQSMCIRVSPATAGNASCQNMLIERHPFPDLHFQSCCCCRVRPVKQVTTSCSEACAPIFLAWHRRVDRRSMLPAAICPGQQESMLLFAVSPL